LIQEVKALARLVLKLGVIMVSKVWRFLIQAVRNTMTG
jgi:hypothetical protein